MEKSRGHPEDPLIHSAPHKAGMGAGTHLTERLSPGSMPFRHCLWLSQQTSLYQAGLVSCPMSVCCRRAGWAQAGLSEARARCGQGPVGFPLSGYSAPAKSFLFLSPCHVPLCINGLYHENHRLPLNKNKSTRSWLAKERELPLWLQGLLELLAVSNSQYITLWTHPSAQGCSGRGICTKGVSQLIPAWV